MTDTPNPPDRQDQHHAMQTMIDHLRLYLKADYARKIRMYQNRLANFDRVNWQLMQSRLAHDLISPAGGDGRVSEQRVTQVLDWLEDTLND